MSRQRQIRIENQVRKESLGQVLSQVSDQIRSQVCEQVANQVYQVRRLALEELQPRWHVKNQILEEVQRR